MEELSQLDELIESDILEALGEGSKEEEVKIEDIEEISKVEDEIILEDIADESNVSDNELQADNSVNNETSSPEKVQANTSTSINKTDLATLLSELLNNKTIEITIKIKD